MDISGIDFTKSIVIIPGKNFSECIWLDHLKKDLSACPLKTIYSNDFKVEYVRIDNKPIIKKVNSGEEYFSSLKITTK